MYPNVGAEGQGQVSLATPLAIEGYINKKYGLTVNVVEYGHNHINNDLKFSKHDSNLISGFKNNKIKLWMWNRKGYAHSLNYFQADNVGKHQGTVNGSRQKAFDL